MGDNMTEDDLPTLCLQPSACRSQMRSFRRGSSTETETPFGVLTPGCYRGLLKTRSVGLNAGIFF